MRSSFYIYYRVVAADSARVRGAIEELQRLVAARTGVTGRLLRRHDDPQTWMEVYESVPDAEGFQTLLQEEVQRLGLDELIGSPRHTEIFRPL